MPQNQQKTKFPGVYTDKNGKFFIQTEFGKDRVTGKRIRKKSRGDQHGNPFNSAAEANKELTRLKYEYQQSQGYSNYRMKYRQFMEEHYIPYYRNCQLFSHKIYIITYLPLICYFSNFLKLY